MTHKRQLQFGDKVKFGIEMGLSPIDSYYLVMEIEKIQEGGAV